MATRPAGWTTYRKRWSGIKGMTKLRRILMRTPPDAGDAIKVEIKKFAQLVERTAAYSANTGDMASRRYAMAIGTKISRAGFSADVGLVTESGRKSAWFAHFIEYGTKAGWREWKGKTKRAMRRRTGRFFHPGTPARPVLIPSFELHKPEMAPRIKRAIDSVLVNVSKGPSD